MTVAGLTPFYADPWLTVFAGDCRAVLPSLPAASIDCVVTSPPYWMQRSYLPDGHESKAQEIGGEIAFDDYLATLVGIAREIRRVLVPAGSMWINLGDKFRANGGEYRYPGALGEFRRGQFSRTLRRKWTHGYPANTRRKTLLLAPFRVALALIDDGWILRDEIVWNKTNALPESVGDRFSRRHESLFRFTLNERAYFDLDAVREPYSDAAVARVQPHRALTFSGHKAVVPGQPARTPRPPLMGGTKGAAEGVTRISGKPWALRKGKNPGDVWSLSTSSGTGGFDHFAMFPPDLVRRPILATCPPGGVVLDPFAGTGTTGQVANELLRRAVLIELDPASLEAIRVRTARRPIVEVPA